MTKKEKLILEGTDPTYLTQSQISWLSESQISGLKKWLEMAKWEKPYTELLMAIKAPGCSLLQKTWHTCETTHCIAGWTVAKAPHGKELETLMGGSGIGTGAAASLILRVSRPNAPLPRFDGSVSEEAIMAFVEARAGEDK